MKAQSFSRMLRLTSAKAATFVTSPASSRFLTPFLGREQTVAAVAAELGVSIGAVTYRVRQMVDLGLLTCTHVQERSGRPIRHYRTVADELFAPLHLTPLDSIRELFSHSRSDIRDALNAGVEQASLHIGRDQDWGTRLYRRHPAGNVNRDFVPASLATGSAFWDAVLDPKAPAVWDQFAALDLTHAQAKQFQQELAELVKRHAPGSPHRRSRRYLVHLALAPAITQPTRRQQ
jgi:hypothetical protein